MNDIVRIFLIILGIGLVLWGVFIMVPMMHGTPPFPGVLVPIALIVVGVWLLKGGNS